MSRLKDKAALVTPRSSAALPPDSPTATRPASEPASPFPVAAHAIAVVNQQRAESELAKVRAERDILAQGNPSVLLDPKVVARSRWANRLEQEFQTVQFQELKADIASAGGNVQPVKVRALEAIDPGGHVYELIFGHRRHQACLELGVPLLAMVTAATDHQLFAEMDRENRSRKDLSLYEQGLSYKRALDESLYPSRRRLAEDLGVNLAIVVEAVQLAELPAAVIEAFPSPLEIQRRWAKPLTDAASKDPAGIIRRAGKAQLRKSELTAKQIFDLLVGASPTAVEQVAIDVEGKRVGVLRIGPSGKATLEFEAGVVPAEKYGALVQAVRGVFS